ncbi:MAG: YceI family protein [Cyclobacteriaceae bacterium]|nr:YceI family protein [Cyclobacteriaceae bacterium]
MKYFLTLVCTVFSLTAFAQHYNLIQTSSISISGTSTLHEWSVNAEKKEGSLLIDTKKNTESYLKKGAISLVTLTVPAGSLHSEKGETMDNKMHRALKAEEHPEIIFELTASIPFDLITENNSILMAEGLMYIAGVKKAIKTQTTAYFANGTLAFSGKIPLKLSDFNIEPPSAMFGQIETGNDIVVNFKLQFKQSD